ncbi:MANSC domain-containing protein 1 [Oxyura jamaicensis]|uniref:MANSC domain-containing protein 1 n=1 Tax=Oxyura jamaicensis TaxID=8884 RepID=UPI0015A54F75|nr:MANSC domain-containing protein 1 [Oxyura jamaicensis]
MSAGIGLRLLLLLLACQAPKPALGQGCSAEKKENAVVDISFALPAGIRGAEPVYASAPEACMRACCLGKGLPGDKKCNFMIFDARGTRTHPNCYLFYCPSTEACPMKHAAGFVSYKIARDTYALEDTSLKNEDFHLNEYSLPLDAGAYISHSLTSHQNHTTALQQSVFHQASELPNHVDKHLDNIEFHTVFPEQMANSLESLDPIPRQKKINLPPNTSSNVQTGNPSALFPSTQSGVPGPSSTTISLPTSTTRLESHTPSPPTGSAKPSAVTTRAIFMHTATARAEYGITTASTAVTHVPLSSPTISAYTSTTKRMASNSRIATATSGLRTSVIPPEPTPVSSNDTSHVTLLSFSDFAPSTSGSPQASQNSHQDYDPSDSESYLSESALRRKGVLQLEDKSKLVAALLFGVVFLLLVIAFMGKKMHESLQKRHYTRLDYLINGMYADV